MSSNVRSSSRPPRDARRYVDPHIHFFNLRYLPIRGLILNRAGPLGIPILALAWLLEATTVNDRSLDDSPAIGCSDLGDPAERGPRTAPPLLSDDASRAVNEFLDSIPTELFEHSKYEEALRRDVLSQPDLAATEVSTLLSGSGVQRRELLRTRLLAHPSVQPMTLHDESAPGLGGILQFLGNLRRGELELLEHAREDQPTVGLFVHLMMDMRTVFKDRPFYDYPRAVARTANLRRRCAALGVCVLPMVAFDPYRPGPNDHDEGLTIVRDAIMNQGFVGVKFYPPLGYRPTGNINSELPEVCTPQQLDARCGELFEFCIREDVPILTHCGPGGMELHPERTGLNADPAYWRRLLESRGMRGLRLCLGHAGSHIDWQTSCGCVGSETPTACPWGPSILALCREFPNVYTDLAHWTEVLTGDGWFRIKSSLEWAVKSQAGLGAGPFPVESKIMYGTDYPMPAPANQWGRYGSEFDRLLSTSAVLLPERERILRSNALAFLNLDRYLRRAEGVLTQSERDVLAPFSGS